MARRREGDWFAVPLGEAGYAVGLIARAPKRGDVLFGYFFGPLRAELPAADDLHDLKPEDALLVSRFRDEAIESGAWPILGSTSAWQRDVWPLPELDNADHAELTGEHVVRRYSEDDAASSLGARTLASVA